MSVKKAIINNFKFQQKFLFTKFLVYKNKQQATFILLYLIKKTVNNFSVLQKNCSVLDLKFLKTLKSNLLADFKLNFVNFLKSFCSSNNALHFKKLDSNKVIMNFFLLKNKKKVATKQFLSNYLIASRLNLYIYTEKIKADSIFWLQFFKKVAADSYFLEFLKIVNQKSNFRENFLYSNYPANFYIRQFFQKTLGRVSKNKVFSIKDEIFDLIRDRVKEKQKIAKLLLASNNAKFLKKKNWRLSSSLGGYIPSKFKKKASRYVLWFTRLYVDKFLMKFKTLPKHVQKRFKFLRNFVKIIRIKKKKIKLLNYQKSLKYYNSFKLLYLKLRTVFKSKKLTIKNYIQKFRTVFKSKKLIIKNSKRGKFLNKKIFRLLKNYHKNKKIRFFRLGFKTKTFGSKFSKNLFVSKFGLTRTAIKQNNSSLPLNYCYSSFLQSKTYKYINKFTSLLENTLKLNAANFFFYFCFKTAANAYNLVFCKVPYVVNNTFSENIVSSLRCKKKLKSIFIKNRTLKHRIDKLKYRLKIKKFKVKVFKNFVIRIFKKKKVKPQSITFEIPRTYFKLNLFAKSYIKTILNYKNKFTFSFKKDTQLMQGFRKFCKKSKLQAKRFYKKCFDFYPHTTYFVTAKNLNKFFLTIKEKKILFLSSRKYALNTKLKILLQDVFSCSKNFTLLGNARIFEILSTAFVELIPFKNHNLSCLDFLYYFNSLRLLSLKTQKHAAMIGRNRLVNSFFCLPKRAKIPGKIVFTLNANTVFLTVSAAGGTTLLQTSTGSLAKMLRVKKIKKETLRGRGFKRRKVVQQIKFRRMIKENTKGKTKKAKKKFIKQVSRRQKGKRKIKVKSKIKFISQDFIKPLFTLLETFLFRVRNKKSRKFLLKEQKLKVKLQFKLLKLKKNNKKKTKTYKDIKNKLKLLKLEKSTQKDPAVKLQKRKITSILFPKKKYIFDKKEKKTSVFFIPTPELHYSKTRLALYFYSNPDLLTNLSFTLKRKLVKILYKPSNQTDFLQKYFSSTPEKRKKKFKTSASLPPAPLFYQKACFVKNVICNYNKNFDSILKKNYLRKLKKRYTLLGKKKSDYIDSSFVKFEKKNKLLFTFLKNSAKKKFYTKFFSSYVLQIKGFSLVSVRRVFIYFIKTLLRRARVLKKTLKFSVLGSILKLYYQTLKKSNEIL